MSISARAWVSPPIRRGTSSSIRAETTRVCSSSIPNGTFVKEWGEGLYGFEFAHKVRVDKDDNVWVVDEGTNMVIKFNPDGRVVMVLGRRPEAVEGAVETPAGRSAAGRAVPVRASNRRGLGCAGQYLRARRLHQPSRREVRQERQVHPPGRQSLARDRTVSVQHAALDCRRRTGQRLRRGPRQRAHPGVRQQPGPARHLRQRRQSLGGVHLTRGRTRTCSRRTRIPTPIPPPRGRRAARSTRWSSTDASSASSAARGRQWASSRRCTASTAAIRTSWSSRRFPPGACRRSACARRTRHRAGKGEFHETHYCRSRLSRPRSRSAARCPRS